MAIATLIAAGRLGDSLLGAAQERLGADAPIWRDGADAARFDVADAASARAALQGWEGVDVIALDNPPERYDLFIADMDSTMIGQECIDELGDMAGVGARVADITERAMRGELDFNGALRERVALLEGLPEEAIARCIEERIRPNAGAERLLATLKAQGVRTVLVSGGFTAFADVIGGRLGFDRVVANVLEIDDGRLTGKVVGEIVNADTKLAVLKEEGAKRAIAIGDGANDLKMVSAARLGIAFRAKPVLAEAAHARLDHHDLDALLWGLGIPRTDWVG
ncbi:phosphoserine phosphatase SerB [Sphingomicrobium flavum]|uniref:phosphoserine phosphatase SerB n=1 Tax=Sphingomicrobium flavum TaxID=1229164 RepID=UPI0021AD7E30|nr:phosphoserine phosphatase SerB [Sphingomicrobium flavum]